MSDVNTQDAREPRDDMYELAQNEAPPAAVADAMKYTSESAIADEPQPMKGEMQAKLAAELQATWKEQIDEKQAYIDQVQKAESNWPYAMTDNPCDKRPEDAVSRPYDVERAAYGEESIN